MGGQRDQWQHKHRSSRESLMQPRFFNLPRCQILRLCLKLPNLNLLYENRLCGTEATQEIHLPHSYLLSATGRHSDVIRQNREALSDLRRSIVRSETPFCSDPCSGRGLISTQHHFLSFWLWFSLITLQHES